MSSKMILVRLTSIIDPKLLEELLKEYDMVKKSHFLEDWEKSILHAAKFSELTLAIVKCIVDKETIDVNNIRFDKLWHDILNRTKITAEDDILLLATPRVTRTIYDIRSKKRVVHVKSIDPNFLDSQYCVSACDWILAQFVMLYLKANVEDTRSIIHSVVEKQIPFLEQFEDGSITVLKENMSFKEQFMLGLYKLGIRTPKKDLARILKTYDQLVNATSKNLEKEKLANVNKDGVVLTKKGIRFVEDAVLNPNK